MRRACPENGICLVRCITSLGPIGHIMARASSPPELKHGRCMANSFSYSVRTTLGRDRVWELLQDIQIWIRVSDVYDHAEWSGIPWVPGSCITGRLKYPLQISFRYVLERHEPPALISYLAHSLEAGFATHRTVELEETDDGTLIKITSYVVGDSEVLEEGFAFLKALTEKWFQGFARFCDSQAGNAATKDRSS